MLRFEGLKQEHWGDIPDEARPRWCEDTQGIIALNHRDEVVAACILDSWSFNSCQIHIWIDNPFVLKHGFQEAVFKHVFDTCEREVIIGITPDDNPKALKFIKHMGFKEIVRIKDGYKDGIDYVITEFRKDAYPLAVASGG